MCNAMISGTSYVQQCKSIKGNRGTSYVQYKLITVLRKSIKGNRGTRYVQAASMCRANDVLLTRTEE